MESIISWKSLFQGVWLKQNPRIFTKNDLRHQNHADMCKSTYPRPHFRPTGSFSISPYLDSAVFKIRQSKPDQRIRLTTHLYLSTSHPQSIVLYPSQPSSYAYIPPQEEIHPPPSGLQYLPSPQLPQPRLPPTVFFKKVAFHLAGPMAWKVYSAYQIPIMDFVGSV
ncbi:hypothetical protein E2P81_ATG09758 [Venturia nashicola]|nr:hypothetical protein E2P81_ATG09758 [Venturia nashicola]